MIKFLKKYHNRIGIIVSVFLLLFAISGIILNHRQMFSSYDVSREHLPGNYRFKNWNLAAVKKSDPIGKDSCLVYGNIGIWLTDKTFSHFSDFNQGLPEGIDNKKTAKIYKTKTGKLYAGTLFGLYFRNPEKQEWQKISLPLENQRIVDICEKDDTLLVLSRSFLLSSVDGRNFRKHVLPTAEGQNNKISLFKTLWTIHSGEIFGTPGKIVVDGIALIFIFLVITGIILFINPYLVKHKKRKNKQYKKLKRSNRWSLKWHNKIGWITLIFLLITTLTGMFLRPPLLITIASSMVSKIPYTTLDDDNTWFDKLRTIHYDSDNKMFMLGTNSGMYYSKDILKENLKPFNQHVPVSVMGITVFEQKNADEYLVGSFEGLFLWNIKTGAIIDYITKKPYKKPKRKGPPIGKYLVSGYIADFQGNECFFDYSKGLCNINGNPMQADMPLEIKSCPMSLWNLMLEIHTARIFQSVLGMFYILIIPLIGLMTLFVLISGFIVWYKRYR
ncbi:MAG: iron-regulated protein [Draconibacterium sp.]|nr:MAG: iron-regulated protein [Draconibacterium sp.]